MENITKVILITYPDRFRLEEARSLVESLPQNKIVKIFTQRYLNRAEYGMGSGKAEEIRTFVQEFSLGEIQLIIVDEH
jgi:GTPase